MSHDKNTTNAAKPDHADPKQQQQDRRQHPCPTEPSGRAISGDGESRKGRRRYKRTAEHEARTRERLKAQSKKEWAQFDPTDPNLTRWRLVSTERADHPKDIRCKAVITDPPYGDTKHDWEPKHLEGFTRKWATQWNTCGADFVAVFWSPLRLFDGYPWLAESLTNYGFQQMLVVVYRNNIPACNKLRFRHKYEPILLFRRKGCATPIYPDHNMHIFNVFRATKPQTNFNNDMMRCHPCQKDVGVFRWLVDALTQPGDLVADPFAGSGACGIAAVQLGRRWYGIELVEEYRTTAMGRLFAYGREGYHTDSDKS